jgi:hypothetical protein
VHMVRFGPAATSERDGGSKAWSMQQDRRRTPQCTTNWDEVPVAHAQREKISSVGQPLHRSALLHNDCSKIPECDLSELLPKKSTTFSARECVDSPLVMAERIALTSDIW